ncbi:hypothetical protein KIPB_008347, partial [Kipferlia bialata]|eukprot:g8347.t1
MFSGSSPFTEDFEGRSVSQDGYWGEDLRDDDKQEQDLALNLNVYGSSGSSQAASIPSNPYPPGLVDKEQSLTFTTHKDTMPADLGPSLPLTGIPPIPPISATPFVPQGGYMGPHDMGQNPLLMRAYSSDQVFRPHPALQQQQTRQAQSARGSGPQPGYASLYHPGQQAGHPDRGMYMDARQHQSMVNTGAHSAQNMGQYQAMPPMPQMGMGGGMPGPREQQLSSPRPSSMESNPDAAISQQKMYQQSSRLQSPTFGGLYLHPFLRQGAAMTGLTDLWGPPLSVLKTIMLGSHVVASADVPLAALALGMLQRSHTQTTAGPQIIVMVPLRDIVPPVGAIFRQICAPSDLRVHMAGISEGDITQAEVVVATVGRLQRIATTRPAVYRRVKGCLCLWAEQTLYRGLRDQVSSIIGVLPKDTQTVLTVAQADPPLLAHLRMLMRGRGDLITRYVRVLTRGDRVSQVIVQPSQTQSMEASVALLCACANQCHRRTIVVAPKSQHAAIRAAFEAETPEVGPVVTYTGDERIPKESPVIVLTSDSHITMCDKPKEDGDGEWTPAHLAMQKIDFVLAV